MPTSLVAAFPVAPWPREVVTLVARGIVPLSRRSWSRSMLGLVGRHVILLFLGLFVANGATKEAGMAGKRSGGSGSWAWTRIIP
ncbi:MAG: hypothetical protein ACT4PV_06950 [Planctomycetaceae bacterium]